MIRFSFTNMLTNSYVSFAQQSDTDWPATNAMTPERPFRPFKPRGDWMQVFFDCGAVIAPDVIALINAAFASASLQGFSDAGATVLTYDESITLTRSANARRHHGHLVSGSFGGRVLRVFVDIGLNQTDAEATNYAPNAGMETWSGGLPVSWVLTGAGATVTQETAIGLIKTGTSSAALTRDGTSAFLTALIHTVDATRPIAWWQHRTVTFGAWVRATVASRAFVGINDGVASVGSTTHSGSGQWEYLSITRTIDGAATQVLAFFGVTNGNTTAQFDAASLTISRASLGGVWAGTLTNPPRDVFFEHDQERRRFYRDVGPDHEAWAERLVLGRDRYETRLRRQAKDDTELAAWREIDRQMDEAGYFLVVLDYGDPAEAYVMRCTERSPWRWKGVWHDSELTLVEVVVP